MKATITSVLLVVLLGFNPVTARAAEPAVIPLWPESRLEKIPEAETIVERSKDPQKHDRSIRFVSCPTLTVYLPEHQQGLVPAVVICPGGGYGGLAIDKEGYDVAAWLNRIGVAGVVLKYRLPRPELSEGQTPWPILDAWRALRLVRGHASEWGIDPARVGIMGFSAGGHLAAMTGVHSDPARPDAADPVERLSTRPDFLVLVYPVISMHDPVPNIGSRKNLLGMKPDPKLLEFYSADQQVTARTPPAFVVQAKDDPIKVENSYLFRDAMRRANVPCDLLVLEKGGHGFGLGVHGGEPSTWPDRCADWMRRTGLLHEP